MAEDEKFSDDPAENLRIENEFLKIKMKAQYGDAFFMQEGEFIPPEMENEFLKNIIAFEENSKNAVMTTVYEKIGKPAFEKFSALKENEITAALKNITAIMEKHQVYLHINDGPYPDEVIYTFITEELFDHEVDKEPVFGSGWNFIYEEFYPNDKADIERTTHNFLRNWFKGDLENLRIELSPQMITAEEKPLLKEEALKKISYFFQAHEKFYDYGYNIYDIGFNLESAQRPMGHAEGTLKYEALSEAGEEIHYEGPYKLYMEKQDFYWTIFYFVMPGFVWE